MECVVSMGVCRNRTATGIVTTQPSCLLKHTHTYTHNYHACLNTHPSIHTHIHTQLHTHTAPPPYTHSTRPRLLWHGAANDWELESVSGPVVELTPAPCNKSPTEDWWWCRVRVPEEAFELKFVISDGDGAYDNNGGQDFWQEVLGMMSKEKWGTLSRDRAVCFSFFCGGVIVVGVFFAGVMGCFGGVKMMVMRGVCVYKLVHVPDAQHHSMPFVCTASILTHITHTHTYTPYKHLHAIQIPYTNTIHKHHTQTPTHHTHHANTYTPRLPLSVLVLRRSSARLRSCMLRKTLPRLKQTLKRHACVWTK